MLSLRAAPPCDIHPSNLEVGQLEHRGENATEGAAVAGEGVGDGGDLEDNVDKASHVGDKGQDAGDDGGGNGDNEVEAAVQLDADDSEDV
jgi:hypothetical protein